MVCGVGGATGEAKHEKVRPGVRDETQATKAKKTFVGVRLPEPASGRRRISYEVRIETRWEQLAVDSAQREHSPLDGSTDHVV